MVRVSDRVSIRDVPFGGWFGKSLKRTLNSPSFTAGEGH